jgi:signal transduction histidine kinase
VRSYELTDLNEQLRRLDAERTRFMILVTHELRAPVGTIYSSLELVRAGYTTPQETQEMLARAQTRASELLELIGDLLNLTKLREQPVRRDSLAPMQIGDVLRDVVEFVQPEVTRNNLSLQVDVAPDLAPVRAVAEQMKLVWTNLLSNAIKYNRPGGSILVTLRQDAGQVTCQVRDTGIGIAPEDLPHMFDEFFRADNAKLVSPHGTGVGLAIIRRIVEGWGGKISVESKLGQGTTFTFVLPRADAHSPS